MRMSEDAPLQLYNTLTQKKEVFTPLRTDGVRLYSCGPTLYDHQHIGNLSNPVFVDVLKRALTANGHAVKHVTNFTDFGHLTSDADEGEDKMAVGLKREGLTHSLENMRALAERYIEPYLEDVRLLGVDTERIEYARASDYIDAQIALIQTLEQKGYTYTIDDGVYFDTECFDGYGALGGVADAQQEEGARTDTNAQKKHPRDFALWKKSDAIGWESPWGLGAPGWHIECSAMILAKLGRQIDIHTGGIEHIGTHHNNEIAQSEAATRKKPFSRFWMHRAHVLVDGRKISKSLGNTIYLRHLTERGYAPLAYRYWLLTAHYRTSSNFTWDALEGAHTALTRLHRLFVEGLNAEGGSVHERYRARFTRAINDDLDTPKAIALLWELVKDADISPADTRATLLHFDAVLGLGLSESALSLAILEGGGGQKVAVSDMPEDIQTLVEQRDAARERKDFTEADDIRDVLEQKGYTITDTDSGTEITQ